MITENKISKRGAATIRQRRIKYRQKFHRMHFLILIYTFPAKISLAQVVCINWCSVRGTPKVGRGDWQTTRPLGPDWIAHGPQLCGLNHLYKGYFLNFLQP